VPALLKLGADNLPREPVRQIDHNRIKGEFNALQGINAGDVFANEDVFYFSQSACSSNLYYSVA
jgi:hypothetical protein